FPWSLNLLELSDILARDGDNLHGDLFFSGATFQQGGGLLYRACTQLIGLLRDGAFQGAFFDSGKSVFGAVKAKDLDFLASAGAQGFDSAEGHLIIFCENGLDIGVGLQDRTSTRLNSSHVSISYAVFCLNKKKNTS